MKLDMPIRHVCTCAIDPIVAALPAVDDPVWDRFAKRQEYYAVHQHTRSIAIVWTDGFIGGKPVTINMGYASPALVNAVRDIGAAILAHYPGGRIVRLMLTELVAGGVIPRHRDGTKMLEDVHRCHVAVTTNPAVHFSIDDIIYHLPAGEAYEFDNMRPHGVANHGPNRRVHLICNILPDQSLS